MLLAVQCFYRTPCEVVGGREKNKDHEPPEKTSAGNMPCQPLFSRICGAAAGCFWCHLNIFLVFLLAGIVFWSIPAAAIPDQIPNLSLFVCLRIRKDENPFKRR
jgi:hypothetical protein